MVLYRLSKTGHAQDISGTGAALFGGRWNKKGTRVLYTSESRALALLEFTVHAIPSVIPELAFVKIEIPDSISSMDMGKLPGNWREYPAPTALSLIGEQWVTENKSLALKVPSSVEPYSYNYILNCIHPEYAEVKIIEIEPFHIDIRLLRK